MWRKLFNGFQVRDYNDMQGNTCFNEGADAGGDAGGAGGDAGDAGGAGTQGDSGGDAGGVDIKAGDAGGDDKWDWGNFDGDETKVPDTHKTGLAAWKAAQAHSQKNYDPMPAVRRVMERLNQGRGQQQGQQRQQTQQRQQQGHEQQGAQETDAQFEARVNQRVNEARKQDRIQQYEQKLNNFFQKSTSIFGYHDTAFSSDAEVEGFYAEMARINREGLAPTDIYLLKNRERVLNDAYEKGKRDGADGIRRAGGSGKAPAAARQSASGNGSDGRAPAKVGGDGPARRGRPGDRILEIMKEKHPEAHESMMSRAEQMRRR